MSAAPGLVALRKAEKRRHCSRQNYRTVPLAVGSSCVHLQLCTHHIPSGTGEAGLVTGAREAPLGVEELLGEAKVTEELD
ncbi:hypothetical protein J1605_021248 [Eschrichtius robustus]|uniref:Uncharacterized protein n=1 Tax=Eschrichtius robustus TaxID=9764 RepID=A0AB34HIT4_ESCRO|nr:hypothetical protein J1605_021248 [Eschrichtius robustus]